jgi:hypothetical protein
VEVFAAACEILSPCFAVISGSEDISEDIKQQQPFNNTPIIVPSSSSFSSGADVIPSAATDTIPSPVQSVAYLAVLECDLTAAVDNAFPAPASTPAATAPKSSVAAKPAAVKAHVKARVAKPAAVKAPAKARAANPAAVKSSINAVPRPSVSRQQACRSASTLMQETASFKAKKQQGPKSKGAQPKAADWR